VDGLRREICDPSVAAVYTQTLSVTDGVTDPLHEILAVIEEENRKRKMMNRMLVTLINDSCLALPVLLHNNGQNGSKNLRVLDMTEGCITPTIIILDAHKHLGADKGISMAMGTLGTLSHLSGRRRVSAQPSNGELVRAVADLTLIGVAGYHEKYSKLVGAVVETTKMIETCGMTIVHSHNRVAGSTVFGVEDPRGAIYKKLKKKGHLPLPLYELCPSDPKRCQTGFTMSLTLHCLREINKGQSALELFTSDLVESSKVVRKNYWDLGRLFHANSTIALWFSSGENFWVLPFLSGSGICRNMVALLLRRVYATTLDCGVACSNKHTAPLKEFLKHSLRSTFAVLLILGMLYLHLRRRSRRLRP